MVFFCIWQKQMFLIDQEMELFKFVLFEAIWFLGRLILHRLLYQSNTDWVVSTTDIYFSVMEAEKSAIKCQQIWFFCKGSLPGLKTIAISLCAYMTSYVHTEREPWCLFLLLYGTDSVMRAPSSLLHLNLIIPWKVHLQIPSH